MLTHSKCHSGIEDTNVMLIWIDNVYTLKKLIFWEKKWLTARCQAELNHMYMSELGCASSGVNWINILKSRNEIICGFTRSQEKQTNKTTTAETTFVWISNLCTVKSH